jgi:hypothetical protein
MFSLFFAQEETIKQRLSLFQMEMRDAIKEEHDARRCVCVQTRFQFHAFCACE